MLGYLILFLTALGASLVFTPLVRRFALAIGAVDQPNQRKIHHTPIPRLGGVAIVLSGALAFLVLVQSDLFEPIFVASPLVNWWPLLLGGTLVFLIGVWDDLRTLRASIKFLFQGMAAGIAIWYLGPVEHITLIAGHPITLGLWAYPLTFLWITGITNAFNLIDGLDGLAAGLGTIAAGTGALIFSLQGDAADAMLLTILCGAFLGFLKYNFNPAQIFLGDSGSLLIGYLLAVIALTGSQKGATALTVVIPLLVFGLPILDTFVSLARRYIRGMKLADAAHPSWKTKLLAVQHMFSPDGHHIHHRLLALGFTHRYAVLVLYTISLALSAIALLSVLAQYRNAGLILCSVGLASYMGIRKLGYEEFIFLETGTTFRWYEQLSFNRGFFLGFFDMALITLAYSGAFILKYEDIGDSPLLTWHQSVFPLVLSVQLLFFSLFGQYRRVWQAGGLAEALRISGAVISGVLLSAILAQMSFSPDSNLSFFCIYMLLLGVIVCGSRNISRMIEYVSWWKVEHDERAVIYGAGRGGQLVLQELRQNLDLGIQPVGFIDDAAPLQGYMVDNVTVLGSSHDLEAILDSTSPTKLIVSSTTIPQDRLRRVIHLCSKRNIPVVLARFQFEALGVSPVDRTQSPASIVLVTKQVHSHDPPEKESGRFRVRRG